MSSRTSGNRPQYEGRRLFVIFPSFDAAGGNWWDVDEAFIEQLIDAVARADDASQAGWRLRAVALHGDASGRRWLEASLGRPTESSFDTIQRCESAGSDAFASRKAA